MIQFSKTQKIDNAANASMVRHDLYFFKYRTHFIIYLETKYKEK